MTVTEKLAALRQNMEARGLEGCIVVTDDFHGSEYVGAHFCPSKPCLPLSIDGMEQYSTLPAEFHPCLRNCALRRPNIHIPRINIYQRCI